MIGRIFRLIFFGGLLLITLFTLVGFHDLDRLAPADTGILAIVQRPTELLVKLDGARLLRLLASPAREDDTEAAASQEAAFVDDPLTMGFLRYFVKKAYVRLPREWSAARQLERQVTVYADLGLPGRVISLLARCGWLAITENRTVYHGYPIFLEEAAAVAFADNFAIIGPEAQVRASLDVLDGSVPALDTDGDDYRLAEESLDPSADVSLLIFGRDLFRPPLAKAGRFDPRLVLNPSGIRCGAADLTFDARGVRGRLVLAAAPNLDVAPMLHDQPGEFATASLADEQTTAYLGFRLGAPTGLTPILLDLYDPLREQDKTVRALAQWLFDTLLKHLATEMALLAPPEQSGAEPVLIARIADQAEVRRLLARKTTITGVSSRHAWLFAAPRRENGPSLAEDVLALKSVEELDALLAEIPAENRGEVGLMAKKVIGGTEEFRRKFLIDSQSIWRQNQRGPVAYWHWRFAGDFLIVAASSELAEEYRRKLEAGRIPETMTGERFYPVNGNVLARLDLTGPLRKLKSNRMLRIQDLLEQRPQLFLGARKDGANLVVAGEAPLRLNVPEAVNGEQWVLIFKILHGLAYVLMVLSLLMLIRTVIGPRRGASRKN